MIVTQYNISVLGNHPLVGTYDNCALYTNSSTSALCTHSTNSSGFQVTNNFTIGSGPLDPNAICSVPNESENYYGGCHIKTEDVQGKKFLLLG